MRICALLSMMVISMGGYSQSEPVVADIAMLPAIQWKFDAKQPIISSPVINEGTVFFGGMDSAVYAIDLKTGKIKWKLKTNGSIRSTLLVEGKKVYLAGGNGVLSCIDKDTGKPIWRSVFDPTAVFLSERSYDFADYYHSSPVMRDNVIYIGSGNGRMNALSSEDGTRLWSFKAGDIIHNKPVIHHGKIFFGCFDGNVYALNISTGDVVWKFKSIGHQYFPDGEVQGSPAYAQGNIFIGTRDYNFYALNAENGNANWNIKFSKGWALAATAEDTVVYIGTSDDRALLAVDARSGEELWRTDVKYNIFGGCAFTKSIVYVASIWGKLYALDKKTGKIKWSFATDAHTLNKSRYYNQDETFRKDIGAILRAPAQWINAEYQMGGIFSTPAIGDDRLVITTTSGVVYCLKAK